MRLYRVDDGVELDGFEGSCEVLDELDGGRAGQCVADHRGAEDDRVDAADRDAHRSHLEPHNVDHGRDSGFTRRVTGQQRRVDVGDHRRDRDEVPAGCLYVRGCSLQRSPHSVQVDVDDAIPIGGSGRPQRLQRAQDTGAGDHDVDRAEVLCDLAEDLLLSFEVADVDGPSAGVAVTAQPGGSGLDAVSGQVEQGDVGAVGAQGAGQARTGGRRQRR